MSYADGVNVKETQLTINILHKTISNEVSRQKNFVLIEIYLNFVCKGSIDSKSVLIR